MFEDQTYMYVTYSFFLFLATFFSGLINWLLLRFSRTLGMRNLNNDNNMIRWGSTSKPSLGGFSFYIIFLFSIAAIGLFPNDEEMFDTKMLGILVASTLGFVVGLADDAYNTNPLVKFIGQFTCANILITTGIVIEVTPVYGINYFLTTLWVIGLMNSINMLDNMDAVTALISVFVIIGCIVMVLLGAEQNPLFLLILVGALGGLIGFLFFNWHPSKIYMGDTGSQFLGVFLAAISIIFFWNYKSDTTEFFQLKQFVMPALIFIVPLIDTTTVVIRRLARRQSPFIGGKDHITHHLAYLGLSDQMVAVVLGGVSLVSVVIVAYIIPYLGEWTFIYSIYVLGYCIFLFIVVQLLYNIGKRKVKREKAFTHG